VAFTVSGLAQEPVTAPPEEWTGTDSTAWFSAGGYASWLHTAMLEKPADDWVNTGMLHTIPLIFQWQRMKTSAWCGSISTAPFRGWRQS